MKYLLVLLILCSTTCTAQLRKGYLHMHGGLSRSNETTTKGILGFSGGSRLGNAIGVGFGIGFIQFEKPYFPLTVDLSLIPTGKKVAPIAGIKAGYGIFNYQPTTTTTVRGGFVGSAFAGITLPGIKLRPNIMIGGTRYSFKSTYQNKTAASDDKRIFVAIGFLF
jgi:hypothetical protein